MEQDISLVMEEFKQNIIDTINNSHFPPAVSYYILKDIFANVEAQYFNYLDTVKRQLNTAAAAAPSEEIENSETIED
jgi:hypothetical protein